MQVPQAPLQILEDVREQMANMPDDCNEIEWVDRVEILLYYALMDLKPVGVSRFFRMVAIHDKFSKYIQREISSKVIWNRLETMFDMAALHESENIPFPNEETDFELTDEFNDVLKEKFGVEFPASTEDSEDSKSSVDMKTSKKVPAKPKQSTPVASAKTPFLTPDPVKTNKNSTGSKSLSRTSSTESVNKVKTETPVSAKISKTRRSSSPFSASKTSRGESNSVTKEDSPESTSSKKSSKSDSSTSSSTKKTPKPEVNSSKKPTRQETNATPARTVKAETPESSSRKAKTEKEVPARKGRPPLSADRNKTSKESKKIIDVETVKRTNDTPKAKTEKNSIAATKGSRSEDADTHSSGSRKSQSKTDTNDKKRKQKEDPAKKTPVPAKRRRL